MMMSLESTGERADGGRPGPASLRARLALFGYEAIPVGGVTLQPPPGRRRVHPQVVTSLLAEL
jgi:hypothetical protein